MPVCMEKIKAIALFSGGLDSVLAAKLVKDLGIEVIGIKFASPFLQGKDNSKELAEKIGIKFRKAELGLDYLKMIIKPKHGRGRNMNPCIDCRIFLLRKAKGLMQKVGAKFIITGEVLGQRPMSQFYKNLMLIEKKSGLVNKILRPLSAHHLPETIPEKKGWVSREKLLGIKGRGRKKQLELAGKWRISGFSSPAGGCLLTEKDFSEKFKELLEIKKKIDWRDVALLKLGRHFRFGKNKIIIGRNEKENKELLRKKLEGDYIFEAQGCGSPITILQTTTSLVKSKEMIRKAAELTAKYSDCKGKVLVKYNNYRKSWTFEVRKNEEEIIS